MYSPCFEASSFCRKFDLYSKTCARISALGDGPAAQCAAQLVDGAVDLRLGELRFQEREGSPAADAAAACNERLAPLAMDLPMKVCCALATVGMLEAADCPAARPPCRVR